MLLLRMYSAFPVRTKKQRCPFRYCDRGNVAPNNQIKRGQFVCVARLYAETEILSLLPTTKRFALSPPLSFAPHRLNPQ